MGFADARSFVAVELVPSRKASFDLRIAGKFLFCLDRVGRQVEAREFS